MSINPLKPQNPSSQYTGLKSQFKSHRKHSVLYKDQSIVFIEIIAYCENHKRHFVGKYAGLLSVTSGGTHSCECALKG